MDCKDVRTNLLSYADGEVEDGLRGDIEGHLERCSVCRRALVREQHLTLLLIGAAAAPVPDDLTVRIMAQARSRKEQPAELHRRFTFSRWNLRVIWQRAAAAAVLALGLTAGGYMGRSVGIKPTGAPEMELAGRVNPVEIYKLDYLTPAPQDSIERVFMTLTSLSEENTVKK